MKIDATTLHTLYDLMEKAQEANLEMLLKWSPTNLATKEIKDSLHRLLAKGQVRNEYGVFWVTDSGIEAMAQAYRDEESPIEIVKEK